MQISLIGAKSDNGVIGDGSDIPWRAKGEQLLFKALTYNQWLLVGRKTFESMGVLPNRKYVVLTSSKALEESEYIRVFSSIDDALITMSNLTDHLIVAGGGQIYQSMIDKAHILHVSTIHCEVDGDIMFPEIPKAFAVVFTQEFQSNIDYTYQIWRRN
jgi:dihydrofolate reductase (trimethoprim resistance protein)